MQITDVQAFNLEIPYKHEYRPAWQPGLVRHSRDFTLLKIITEDAPQSPLRNPLEVAIGDTACTIICGLRGNTRHLRLPSLNPALAILVSVGNPSTECTPGTVRIVDSKRSAFSITS